MITYIFSSFCSNKVCQIIFCTHFSFSEWSLLYPEPERYNLSKTVCRSGRWTFSVLMEGGLGVLPLEKNSMKGMKWWILVQFRINFNTNYNTYMYIYWKGYNLALNFQNLFYGILIEAAASVCLSVAMERIIQCVK